MINITVTECLSQTSIYKDARARLDILLAFARARGGWVPLCFMREVQLFAISHPGHT